MKDRLVICSQI
ncbi:unnamed protein product, partial [Allacma fusca]